MGSLASQTIKANLIFILTPRFVTIVQTVRKLLILQPLLFETIKVCFFHIEGNILGLAKIYSHWQRFIIVFHSIVLDKGGALWIQKTLLFVLGPFSLSQCVWSQQRFRLKRLGSGRENWGIGLICKRCIPKRVRLPVHLLMLLNWHIVFIGHQITRCSIQSVRFFFERIRLESFVDRDVLCAQHIDRISRSCRF